MSSSLRHSLPGTYGGTLPGLRLRPFHSGDAALIRRRCGPAVPHRWRGRFIPAVWAALPSRDSLPAVSAAQYEPRGGRASMLPPALAHNSVGHTSQDFERPDLPVIAVRVFAHSKSPSVFREQSSEGRFACLKNLFAMVQK